MKQDDKAIKENSKKSAWYKSYVFYGLLAIVVTIIACVTFAYFVDDGDETGTVSFGVIEIDREDSYFRGANVDNVLPGGKMVDEIAFKKSDRSRNYYARLKIEFSIPESNIFQLTEIVDQLNATIEDVFYTSSDYTWEYSSDGYFYLIKTGGGSVMYEVTTTDKIIFTRGVNYPTDAEQVFSSNDPEDNFILQVGSTIEVAVTVEVIQSQYQESGSVSTVTQIKRVFPTTSKSFSFAYMDDVEAPAVDTSSLNVGDSLPVVTKENYRIVWFNHKDAINEPYVSTTAKIRPGVKYYGMWFYTGNSGYSASGVGITEYSGAEKNIILPRTVGSYSNITNLFSLGSSNVCRVIIPEGYTSVSGEAFKSTPLLNILMFPTSLTSIGSRLFGTGNTGYCNVQYLTIPANVISIGENALNAASLCQVRFLGTKVLVENMLVTEELNSYFEIIVPNISHYKTGFWRNLNIVSGSQYRRIYEDGVFYTRAADESSYTAYAANRNLEDVVIKEEIEVDNVLVAVTAVDNHFNSYNNNLKTVVVGNNIRTVKSMCKEDRNLTQVTFGYSITTMEAYALDDMPALKTLVFLGRVTSYNANAITSTCTAIEKIYVPSSALSYYRGKFSSSAISTSYTILTGTP